MQYSLVAMKGKWDKGKVRISKVQSEGWYRVKVGIK